MNIMHFINRIPWESDDPDITAVLDLLLAKGVDFKAGEYYVRIERQSDATGLIWYHVNTHNSATQRVFTEEYLRDAIAYFVYECDRVQLLVDD